MLFTGMGGVLGHGLAAHRPRDGSWTLAGRNPPPFWRPDSWLPVDFSQAQAWPEHLAEDPPDALLHAAAVSRIETCEQDPEECQRVNLGAVRDLLDWLPGSRLVFISTDQVFAGTGSPLDEQTPPDPLHVYGRSKAAAEDCVLAAGGTVVRLPLLLGPAVAPGRCGADEAVLQAVRAGKSPRLFVDEIRCPVSARAVAFGLWTLLEKVAVGQAPGGVFHLAGREAVSRHQLGVLACETAGLATYLQEARAEEWTKAPRPLRLILTSERAAKELAWQAPELRQCLTTQARNPDD